MPRRPHVVRISINLNVALDNQNGYAGGVPLIVVHCQ